MTRQSRHKHRVLRLMLSVRAASKYHEDIVNAIVSATRTMSKTMSEVYAKARAEREGQA